MNVAFENQLAGLRRRFCDRAANQSHTLEGLAFDLDNGAPAPHLELQVWQIVHSLAGAGGTFGFSALSAYATGLLESRESLSDPPALANACRALAIEVRRAMLQRSDSNGGP
jgi:hypothetical protein